MNEKELKRTINLLNDYVDDYLYEKQPKGGAATVKVAHQAAQDFAKQYHYEVVIKGHIAFICIQQNKQEETYDYLILDLEQEPHIEAVTYAASPETLRANTIKFN